MTAEDVARAANPTPDVAKPVQQALAAIATSVQSGKYVRTWIGAERGDGETEDLAVVGGPQHGGRLYDRTSCSPASTTTRAG